MKRMMAIGCVLAMMSGGVHAWQSAPQSSTVQSTPSVQAQRVRLAKKKKKKQSAPVQQLPQQTTPPLPATLMNTPPVKPSVMMESGQLTIDAPNSTLGDVLSGIRKATGAAIEGASPSERVSVKLGPGNPEQVIAALLRGTPYDYVILGSLGKRDSVTRVLLSQQASQSFQSADATPSQTPPDTGSQPQPEGDDAASDRTSPDDSASQPEVEYTPDREPTSQQPQQPGQPQQPQPDQPKTPEQLFKELQQLEQQKQQPR
jgi:hypothetical protein